MHSDKTRRVLPSVLAFLFCISAAILAVILFNLFSESGHRPYVPLVFILVAIVAASRWGSLGAVLGLVASAAVFALFLFSPIGSLRVSADAARVNLGWMLLLGLPSAYLFAKPPGPTKPHSNK